MSEQEEPKGRILILGETQIRELEGIALALESIARGIRDLLASQPPEWPEE